MEFHRAHAPERRLLWLVLACLLAASVVASLSAGAAPARADSSPADPSDPATPPTVTADGLPTVQIDGVGLTQVVIGRTVFVGGTFTTARPAGAAPGAQTVQRWNLLAYDLESGVLKAGFRPRLNGSVQALAASPDGKRLYVGGSFTRVNGKVQRHLVALNPTTGTRVTSFRVGTDKTVRAIVANSYSVWFGGDFHGVRGVPRSLIAKVRASNGAVLPWRPKAAGGSVTAMALNGPRRSLVVGGRFTSVNGSSRPGYGLAKVDSLTGKMQPLPVNRVIRNGGSSAGITSLTSDGTNFYGSGFAYGYTDGNLEGAFAASWSDGRLVWVASCHGDTYDVYVTKRALYTAGHAHNCRNIGGFPDTDPKTYHYAIAFSKATTGVNAAEPIGSRYHSFTNRPAPSLLTWFPSFDIGDTTAARQAAWSVTGRGSYVAVAGEFKHVNGTSQQGLVRFVTTATAPNAQKPRLRAGFATPTATRFGNDVTITWETTWDRDNRDLTYQVYRRLIGSNVDYAPISSPETRASDFWDPQQMTYTDSAPASGTYRYQVRATDPLGNTQSSQVTDPVTVP